MIVTTQAIDGVRMIDIVRRAVAMRGRVNVTVIDGTRRVHRSSARHQHLARTRALQRLRR